MDGIPIAVVTGASSGIGAAVAGRLGSSGYAVVLTARSRERLEIIAGAIRAKGGEALVVQADLGNTAELDRLVDLTIGTFGHIDVLVNNAGIGRLNWLEDLRPDTEVEHQLQINLTGAILLTRKTLPHMLTRQAGHIINMASMASFVAIPTYTVYAASKFGLRGFTEALHREVRDRGIHVTGIYPGPVATPLMQEARSRPGRLRSPAWMVLQPDDVARAVEQVLRRPRPAVILPAPMRLVALFAAHFPGVVDRFVTSRFARAEEDP